MLGSIAALERPSSRMAFHGGADCLTISVQRISTARLARVFGPDDCEPGVAPDVDHASPPRALMPRWRMAPFDGQVAFITGASSGIGAALARELAQQGADV